MAKLLVLDSSGHKEVEYDVEVPIQIESARHIFDVALARGGMAFKIVNGQKFLLLTKFDETAEEILVTPRIVGG